jgi:hypothetical protein
VVPGGIALRVTGPDGTVVPGAEFTLTDLTGTTTASGTTDAQGSLAFDTLPAGVYHLKQTTTGSTAFQLGPDTDVIVTDGTTVAVTVTDPFTPAELTVHVTDYAHNPLPGAVVAVTDDTGKTLTATTGTNGSAQVSLPVTTRTGTSYTATIRSGPHDAPADSAPVTVRAEPAALVAITLTDTSASPTTSPTSTQSAPAPGTTPDEGNPASTGSGAPAPPASTTAPSQTASAPRAQLAHTGANATGWLTGTAGLLMVIGAGALSGIRYRRRSANGNETGTAAAPASQERSGTPGT